MSDKVSDLIRGTPLTLYNRFAELMLVVGLDENTGLVSLRKDLDSDDESEDPLSHLFNDEYEARVLVAISASKALVFQPYIMEDLTYPPSAESLANMSNFHTVKSRSDKHTPGKRIRNVLGHHTMSVNPAVVRQHLTQNEHTTSSTNVHDLPLSKDAIETISTFCFPDNAHIYAEKPDSNIHFLVLTDVYRSKTYASCLTFYKPYWLSKGKDGAIRCVLDDPNQKIHKADCGVRCYLPQCCVLVSKYPYFYAMKECLSCMISHIERDYEEMYHFLKDFTYTMTMAPVPPAGDVIVEMSICNLSVPLVPPESPEKPVIDLPLHLVFLCFPIDELLKIFTAILCEERLVFVSFNYALLTTVMESFLYFILPFNWRFTYVPILSASCLELLDAPGTFIMGCHSKHLNDVVKVEGLVVVNIDEGVVSVNGQQPLTPASPELSYDPRQTFVFLENISKFPSLPSEPVSIFKNICRQAKFQRELSDVQRPFYYNIEEERAFRMKKCLQFNTEISFIFLEMMVNLFRGTLSCLRIDHQLFNKQRFMETIPEDDKPFYEKVLNTDMFKQFLEDRLKGKVDYWSDYEKKTQPYTKRNSGPLASPVGSNQRHQSKPMPKQVSVTTFNSLSQRVFEVFRLPTLNDSVSYVKNTIGLLNKNIEECRSIHLRSSYIYLRGMFHAAAGNVESALSDLLSLHAHNARLLPMSLVYTLLQKLPEADREDMLRKRGITDIHDPGPGRPTRPKLMAKVPIPDCDLTLEDFVKTVSLLDMATDYDTIKKLFQVLAHPQRPTYVDKYTFDVLRLSYEENLAQCDALVLPIGSLQPSEVILRVSNLIKTDFGMGRIVLTDKRLFFIKDVSNKCREIVQLRNIAQLEKVQYHSLLRPVDCLLISATGNKVKFTAWLKAERNCWAALIEEMRAGKIVAEAIKDFTAIGHAIHNVLLIDAVVRSGQDESVAHYGQVTHAAETLCYFTSYMAEGRHILPRDTTSALKCRVDPNIGQRERQSVLCMLYTAGRSYNSIPPRLWCGVGNGQVRVFDATAGSLTLEESVIQAKNTVSALVAVGDSQVWAGSHGIFIIDTETVSCNKTLMDHPDLVVDIIVTHQGRYVYSGSVDGTIIQWELQTLRVIKTISLPNIQNLRNIRLHNDRLWCGTWHYITALDLEGTPLQVFTHTQANTGKPIQLDCFEVFNNEIWAGCRREGQVVIWDEMTTRQKTLLTLDCSGISVLLVVGDKVWIGTKDGVIYIYNSVDKQLWKTIRAHDDAIRSMCTAESRYVLSGAGSKDGKVAIWSPNIGPTDLEVSCNLSSE